jgi:outer membrane immunogenic protein
MRGTFVAAAVMTVAAMSAAHAADLPDLPILRGGITDSLTTARVNWDGFYVGGQGDWGSASSKVPGGINGDLTGPFAANAPAGITYNFPALGQAHSIDGGFGGFFGYNAQWDDVVLGFEGNYIHENFRPQTSSTGLTFAADNVTVLSVANSTATVKLSDFGSFRVRAGYAIGCFLPYGFVGAGFGSQTIDRTVSANPNPVGLVQTYDSKGKLVYGYTFGAGFDVTLIGGLFARAEYEYRRIATDVESNVNTVRGGLGYKF